MEKTSEEEGIVKHVNTPLTDWIRIGLNELAEEEEVNKCYAGTRRISVGFGRIHLIIF